MGARERHRRGGEGDGVRRLSDRQAYAVHVATRERMRTRGCLNGPACSTCVALIKRCVTVALPKYDAHRAKEGST